MMLQKNSARMYKTKYIQQEIQKNDSKFDLLNEDLEPESKTDSIVLGFSNKRRSVLDKVILDK
jgi:hypothetical protein